MSRRLRIQAGSSPFRVSRSGVDATGADFEQVLFDANQAPLRLWSRGYTTMPKIENGNIAPAQYVWASSRPATPAGTDPLFLIMWRCQKLSGDPAGPHTDGSIQHVTPGYHNLGTIDAGGGGGVMGKSALYAINFCRQSAGYYYQNYINFAIFRNYL